MSITIPMTAIHDLASTCRGSILQNGPGHTGHDQQVFTVTYSTIGDEPHPRVTMGAARYAAANLDDLIGVAYGPVCVTLVVVTDVDPHKWAVVVLQHGLGRWGARLSQIPEATVVYTDPSDWQEIERSAERYARNALVRLGDEIQQPLHQCERGWLCTCLTTGNLVPNNSTNGYGERGSLAGRLTDPLAVRNTRDPRGWSYSDGGTR